MVQRDGGGIVEGDTPVTPVVTPEPVQPAPETAVAEAPQAEGRHFLAAFFFSFMWGLFGADRFYLGKYWTGLLKLLTFGGYGLWMILDLSAIMSGSMKDKQGRPLLEYERYKSFAHRTVTIFSVAVLLLVVGGIAIAVIALQQAMNALGGGDMTQLLEGNRELLNLYGF